MNFIIKNSKIIKQLYIMKISIIQYNIRQSVRFNKAYYAIGGTATIAIAGLYFWSQNNYTKPDLVPPKTILCSTRVIARSEYPAYAKIVNGWKNDLPTAIQTGRISENEAGDSSVILTGINSMLSSTILPSETIVANHLEGEDPHDPLGIAILEHDSTCPLNLNISSTPEDRCTFLMFAAVNPCAMRQGIGKSLLQAAEQRAAQNNSRAIFLSTHLPREVLQRYGYLFSEEQDVLFKKLEK
jgi:hypothetical protein